MIASLRGELIHAGKDAMVLDVGGVGYHVQLSQRHLATLPELGATVRVFTHLVHREDAMLLYGFQSQDERELFLLLNGVSGIGAKTALGVLSALSVPEVVAAVVGSEPRRLATAPGVGKKTAERIVLELREKLQEWHHDPARQEKGETRGTRLQGQATGSADDAELALLALGYGDAEVAEALERAGAGSGVEDRLRRALAHLSRF